MARGVVKWFNNEMKYGFINTEQGQELFVHFSEIQSEGYKTLKKGDVVEFDIEKTGKGEKAVNVRKLMSRRKRDKKKSDWQESGPLNSNDGKPRFVLHRGVWIDPHNN